MSCKILSTRTKGSFPSILDSRGAFRVDRRFWSGMSGYILSLLFSVNSEAIRPVWVYQEPQKSINMSCARKKHGDVVGNTMFSIVRNITCFCKPSTVGSSQSVQFVNCPVNQCSLQQHPKIPLSGEGSFARSFGSNPWIRHCHKGQHNLIGQGGAPCKIHAKENSLPRVTTGFARFG